MAEQPNSTFEADLRDRFAAAALPGLVGDPRRTPEYIALRAYEVAGALVAHRRSLQPQAKRFSPPPPLLDPEPPPSSESEPPP